MKSVRMMMQVLIVCVVTGVAFMVPAFADTKINDNKALEGVQSAKGLFDINVNTAEKLELYLTVIRKTHSDLERQGQTPNLIIAFRGATVRLINSEVWSFSEEDQKRLARSAALIKELKGLGVRIEACSIATSLYKVENSTILPEIKVVGNTFVSLIGYQAQGYSLVPIQ